MISWNRRKTLVIPIATSFVAGLVAPNWRLDDYSTYLTKDVLGSDVAKLAYYDSCI